MEVAVEFGVVPGLHRGVVGDVQEGRRRGDAHSRRPQVGEGPERGRGRLQIRDPDVASVDDSAHQGHVGEVDPGPHVGVGEAGELVGGGVDGLDARLGQGGDGLPGVPVGRRDEQSGAAVHGCELLPRAECGLDEVAAVGGQIVGGEGGLVELDPGGPRRAESGEEVGVGVDHVLEPVEGRVAFGGPFGGLGQGEPRHRADEDRSDVHARLPGLLVAVEHRAVRQGDGRVRADFRHQVVVVRVEPLRHLQGRRLVVAPGEREVQIVTRAAREARRDGPQEHCCVENLVVE